MSHTPPDLGPGGDILRAYHLDKVVEPDMDDEDASFDPMFDPVTERADPDSEMFIVPLDNIELELAAPAVDVDKSRVNPAGFTYDKSATPRRGALKGTRPESQTIELRKAKLGKRIYVPSHCPKRDIENGQFWKVRREGWSYHRITTVQHNHIVPEQEEEIQDGFLCRLPYDQRFAGSPGIKLYPRGPRYKLNMCRNEWHVDQSRASKFRDKPFPTPREIAKSTCSARRRANMIICELRILPPKRETAGRYVHSATPVIFRTDSVCVCIIIRINTTKLVLIVKIDTPLTHFTLPG